MLQHNQNNAYDQYTNLVGSTIMLDYFTKIYSHLKDAEKYYPKFNQWYYDKVISGVLSSEREIILEARTDKIAGIAIIKNDPIEKKLSTLRITPEFQNKGIGLKLFEKTFSALETEKPFLTVSEEKLCEFKKVFDYYGFKLTSVHQDLYRRGKKEYFFNEG